MLSYLAIFKFNVDLFTFGFGLYKCLLQAIIANPELIAALNEQSQKLWHLSNYIANEPAISLAKQLTDLTFAEVKMSGSISKAIYPNK